MEFDPEGRQQRALLEMADWRGARVLDLGCGEGRSIHHFVERAALTVGIDVTVANLSAAAREHRDGAARTAFVAADAIALPFRAGSFDLAVFTWSLWCVAHGGMVHALREAGRVLRAGGLLLDLRPLAVSAAVEVPRAPAVRVGEVRASGRAREDDAAVERATHATLESPGWSRNAITTFELYFYYDGVDELIADVGARWQRRHLVPSPAEEATLRHAVASHGGHGRLRASFCLLLSSYRRN